MKYFQPILLMTLLSLLFRPSGIAQSSAHPETQNDQVSEKIPPLSVLIDSAILNNPNIRFRDMDLIVARCKLKENHNLLWKDIGFQADVRHGTFDSYTSDITGGIGPAIGSSHVETRYGYSAYIKIPLFDLINRPNQNKIARTEIEKAESLATAQRNEIRQLVILQYNDLILKQRLFNIKLKNLETVKINMQMVEKEFLNGVIPITEYARISGSVSDSETDYEKARMDFLTAYMILEEIVGMKFNLPKTITGTDENN